jgi:hypothetical protein
MTPSQANEASRFSFKKHRQEKQTPFAEFKAHTKFSNADKS